MSQPAISRQIGALEAELDVRLFDRVGRRIHLTSEGQDSIFLQQRNAAGDSQARCTDSYRARL